MNRPGYILIKPDDTRISACFKHGFMPIGDSVYVDKYLLNKAQLSDGVAFVPQIESVAEALVRDTVNSMQRSAEQSGTLTGTQIQNIASWILTWSVDMAWCWSKNDLKNASFKQDTGSLKAPLSLIGEFQQDGGNDLVESFMTWCFGNPGYTDRHQLDIYDPIRDGYMAIIRVTVTKVLTKIHSN